MWVLNSAKLKNGDFSDSYKYIFWSEICEVDLRNILLDEKWTVILKCFFFILTISELFPFLTHPLKLTYYYNHELDCDSTVAKSREIAGLGGLSCIIMEILEMNHLKKLQIQWIFTFQKA